MTDPEHPFPGPDSDPTGEPVEGAAPPPPPPPPPSASYPLQPGQPPQQGAFAPPAPPAKKSRTGLIIGVVAGVVVVLVVIAVVVGLLVSHRSNNLAAEHSLSVPQKAGSYVRLGDANAQRLGKRVLTSAQQSDSEGVYGSAKVGVFAKSASAQPQVILLGINVRDSKGLVREMGLRSLSAEADTIIGAARLSGVKDYPTGTFGGQLRCASLSAGGTTLPTCVWLDHSTLGIVYQIGGTPASAARVAKDIREAGEK